MIDFILQAIGLFLTILAILLVIEVVRQTFKWIGRKWL